MNPRFALNALLVMSNIGLLALANTVSGEPIIRPQSPAQLHGDRLAAALGSKSNDPTIDRNGDGRVDSIDAAMLLNNWAGTGGKHTAEGTSPSIPVTIVVDLPDDDFGNPRVRVMAQPADAAALIGLSIELAVSAADGAGTGAWRPLAHPRDALRNAGRVENETFNYSSTSKHDGVWFSSATASPGSAQTAPPERTAPVMLAAAEILPDEGFSGTHIVSLGLRTAAILESGQVAQLTYVPVAVELRHLPSDLDRDGRVGMSDLSLLADAIDGRSRMSAAALLRHDLNNDGFVDAADLGVLVDQFGSEASSWKSISIEDAGVDRSRPEDPAQQRRLASTFTDQLRSPWSRPSAWVRGGGMMDLTPPRVMSITPSPSIQVVNQFGISSLQVVFSEPVVLGAASVALYRQSTGIVQDVSMTLGDDSTTLDLSLAEAVKNDRLYLVLRDTIADLAGNELDGEIVDPTSAVPPSGNGRSGGDFVVAFQMLQGDINRDGETNLADAQILAGALGAAQGDALFDSRADLNGDGFINVLDVAIYQAAEGQSLVPRPLALVGINATDPPVNTVLRQPSVNSIRVDFDGNISTSLLNSRSLLLLDPSGARVVPSSVDAQSTSSVTFSFDQPLSAPGDYRLQLSQALTDASGFLVAAGPFIDRSFRLDSAPARIQRASPTSGEGSVALTRESIIEFSRPLSSSSINPAAITATFGATTLPGHLMLSAQRDRLTHFYEDPLPPNARVRLIVRGDLLIDDLGLAVDADGDGLPGGTAIIDFDTITLTTTPGTSAVGRVFASKLAPGNDGSLVVNVPLEGVRITVDGAEDVYTAITDEKGIFRLDPAPVGRFFVHIDGRTATNSSIPVGAYYPFVGKAFETVAGTVTDKGDIYLPLVAPDTLQPVSVDQDTVVTFPQSVLDEYPQFANVAVMVPAGSLMNDDGTPGGSVGIAPVPPDRIPGALPPGLTFPIVITVQTDGATNFDVPVPVAFPNLPDPVTGVTPPPGAKSALWSFDHDLGYWVINGSMTVSEDGLLVLSDPGTGIRAPGWHGAGPGSPGAGGPGPAGGGCGPPTGGKTIDEKVYEFAKDGARCIAGLTGLRGVARCLLEIVLQMHDLYSQAVSLANSLRPGEPLSTPALGLLCYIKSKKDTLAALYDQCKEGGSPLTKAQAMLDCLETLRDAIRILCIGCGDDEPPPGCPRPSFLTCIICNGVDFVLSSILTVREFIDFLENIKQDAVLAAICQIVDGIASVTGLDDACDDLAIGYYSGGNPPVVDAELIEQVNLLVDQLSVFVSTTPQTAAFADGLDDIAALVDQEYAAAVTVMESSPGRIRSSVFYRFELGDPAQQENLVTIRGRSSVSGEVRQILPPVTDYQLTVYDPVSNMLGESIGVTAPNGVATALRNFVYFETNELEDTDLDGMANDSEAVVGTNPNLTDTDGDGISDFAEVQQGTNPLDGVLGPQTGVIASADTPGVARDIVAFDDLAVVADGSSGISVFNVFNGLFPQLIVQVDTPGNALAVELYETTVLVADDTGGLMGVDISDPPASYIRFVVSPIELGGKARAVASAGGLAFVGTDTGAVGVVDIASGQLLQVLQADSAIFDIASDLSYVYALTAQSLIAYEIEGASLAQRGFASAPGAPQATTGRNRLSVGDGFALSTWARGYNTFDLSDPAQPLLLAMGTTGQFGWKQIVPNGSGLGLAAVSPNSSSDGPHHVYLYDLSDPLDVSRPIEDRFLTLFETTGVAYAVEIYNGLVYVADGSRGLQVIAYRPTDTFGVPPTADFQISHFDPHDSEDARLTGLWQNVEDFMGVRLPMPHADAVEGLASLLPDGWEGGGSTDPLGSVTEAVEGSLLTINAIVSDDVQVRNVDLLVNGDVVATDGNFPFQFTLVTPTLASLAGQEPVIDVTLRASDTGGNRATSPARSIDVLPDLLAPQIASVRPGAGQTIQSSTFFEVVFTEPMDPESADAQSVLLVGAGPDGELDTADDVPLSAGVAFSLLNRRMIVRPTAADPVGLIKLSLLGSGITDTAGNLLDGDGDGLAGGDFATFLDHQLLGYGSVVSALISAATAPTTIGFQASAGDTVTFSLSASVTLRTSLISPSGQIVFDDQSGSRNWPSIELLESGTYRLLLNLTGPFGGVFTIALSDEPVEAPSAASLGAPFVDEISPFGDVDHVEFELDEPSTVSFEPIAAAPGLVWACTGPDGTLVFSTVPVSQASGPHALPPGRYSIRIGAATNDATSVGAYGFTVEATSTP